MKATMGRIFILTMLLLITTTVSLTGSQAARIWMNGFFSDWDAIPTLYSDPSGDQQIGDTDFGVLKVANDDRFVFLYIEVGDELSLQNDNEITLYLDTDNNESTGIPINGIGAEVKWIFGERYGTYTSLYTIYHKDLELVTEPTVTSNRFEIAIDRTLSLFGQELFPQNSFRIVFHDNGPGNDYLPDVGDIVSYSFDDSTLPPIISISLKKAASSDFRVVTYNVLTNNIFDPSLYDTFDRILSAIEPDIIAFEEIYNHTASDVQQLVESMLPSGTGEQWYCQGIYGDDIYAVSRFTITESYALNKSGAFMIDLNTRVDSDLLFIVGHLTSGNNNEARQLEIDEMMAFIRDAKEPGGILTLEENTPILITGDLNLVGYAQQLETLLTGDIVNPQFGPDFSPDWDGSDFSDLCARLTDLPMFYTWYNEYSSYYPGRLDFMIYSDYVLSSERKFVMFTPEMNADTLGVYGLIADDVINASDHIPLVSDFKVLEPILTSIYDIQYTTEPGPEGTYPSLMAGETVATSGIVTAVGYSGYDTNFFVSSPDGEPWEGIYIYYADTEPSIGDMVEVCGEVYEYNGFTEIRYANTIVISAGNPVPEPMLVNTGDLVAPVDAEAYEGCLVKVENVTVTQEPDQYNQWYIDNGTGECQVDDNIFAYSVFLGEQFEFIIGVLDYNFVEYGLLPRFENDLLPLGNIKADFSVDINSGNAPLTVNFTDLSIGDPTNWEWDFQNDGTIDSYEQNPEWAYTNQGTYTVSLTVSDGTNTDTEIKTDYIYVQALISIYDIQYTTEPGANGTYPSLMAGDTVSTSGIVTAVGYSGYDTNFFISSPEGEHWEGIYIYYADTEPDIGDMVEVCGEVYEYNGFTEIRYANTIVISAGNPVPEPMLVNTGDLVAPVDAEAYEGCLVKVENVTVTQEPDPNNEWYIDDGTGECQVDDKIFAYSVSVGDQFEYIIGVLDYNYAEYGINPRDIDDLCVYSIIPENIIITIDTDSINIVWDEVPGCTYNLYSSTDPYATKPWLDVETGISDTSWSAPLTDEKKFYYVTAVESQPTKNSSKSRQSK